MASSPRKKRFEVRESESIVDCLNRMKEEGYSPVRRIEKPVFKEAGKDDVEHVKQNVIFEGILTENTNDGK